MMKTVYPVLFKSDKDGYLVYVPDIDAYTEGKDLYDAMYMARDLIGTYSLDNDAMPQPSTAEKAFEIAREKADDPEILIFSDGILHFIDIDTEEYKRKLNTKAVKKTLTIPSWLNDKAESAGINFSRILQDALISKLGV